MGEKGLGILMAIGGVILFSAKAVMVKMAYNYPVDALSLLLLRMIFSIPIYLIILIFYTKPKADITLEKKDYAWLLLFGFLGYYIASYLDFVGLQYLKASLERIILFVYPTLVLLISRIFLKVKINAWQVAAIGVSYLGIIITFSDELTITNSDTLWLGAMYIFMAALTYASYLVGSGWLIPRFGSVRFTALAMVVACCCVVTHYLIMNDTDITSFPKEVYVLGIMMAIFATVLPSFLVSEAIKHIGANNFGIIGSLGPISTIILASIFLDEKMSLIQVIGTLLVIGGIIILARNKEQLRNEAA